MSNANKSAASKSAKSAMISWFEHFRLSADPFNEDSVAWNFFYGGGYGIASLKLEQALERKGGLIVVTGPPGSGKSALVRNSLGRMRACASATVSAAQTSPSSVIDVLLRSREPVEGGFSPTRKRAALLSMIEQARATGRPILCVIEDAHLARAGQIKDLIHAIDTAPEARRVFHVLLVGRPPLLDTLRARALSDLRPRTTAIIETTTLAASDVTEFLYERLEAAEAPVPDAILPPLTISAVAHHSRGIIGLAAALARSALERAAESGTDTVSVELVEEVASLYGRPGESGSRPKHRTASAFAFGAMAALITLALVTAAAQVQLLGSGDRRIRVNVEKLRALAGFGEESSGTTVPESTKPPEQLRIEAAGTGIGLGSPRDEFLRDTQQPPSAKSGERAPGNPAGSGPRTGASGPTAQGYDVKIKPPARPGSPTGEAETTTITVPGIPGPVGPGEKDKGSARVIRSSDYTPPLTQPAEQKHGGAVRVERQLPGHVPLPEEPADVGAPATVVDAPKISGPLTPPATDTATARNAPSPEYEMGPQISLQVGAFRERSSADALRDRLAEEFKDVYVSTIHSGGEPLYRVRVGKFKAPEETASLKARLQAAGYASFRVSEP